MTILHQNLLIVTCRLLPLILPLLQGAIYDYLVHKYRRHWLVQLEEALDLAPLEQACAAFHKGSGQGSAVSHPVPRLVRALLVKYLYNLSYRQTEEKIDRDLLVKWFVGYGLFQSPPDHTTLQRFEIWLLNHQPHLFFNDTLGQIDELDPGDGRQLQLVDTFAMLARAAKASLIPLIREASRKLLEALQRANPERYEAALAQLDSQALFGQKGDKPSRALNAQQRAERLQQVVTEALWLQRLTIAWLYQSPLPSPEAFSQIEHWLMVLGKIIHDETSLSPTEPEAPEQVTVTERPHGQKGSYRIAALSDTETTFRHHGADKGEGAKLAYNATVLTGNIYVRQTQADTGARPDCEPLPELLQKQHQQQGFWPDKVVGDQAYGTGKVRARVEQATQAQTQVVALLPSYEKRADSYSPANFTFSAADLTLTCPNKVVTDKFTDRPDAAGRTFRFTPKMCRDCPLFVACRGSKANPKARRSVFISYYRPYILAALEYNKSEQFKLDIKQRPIIERLIFNLTNLHGARRAKSAGLIKANFQLSMQATAFNIRQLLRRWPKLKPNPVAA